MAQKRPCEDHLPNGVSSKYARQMGVGDCYVSYVDMVSVKEATGKLYQYSGEGGLKVNTGLEGQGITANFKTPGSPDGTEVDNSAGIPRSLSLSPWAASSTSEEDCTLDREAPVPFTTEHVSFGRATISPLQANELYNSLLNFAPRKSIPVGPEHQADVPELPENIYSRDENDEMAGKCLVRRNDLKELAPYDKISVGIGIGRADCDCMDVGSVRCVKQHIKEAREKLLANLGQEAFVNLGFCEMGEVEAQKWSKSEQQLFRQVVICNPASTGKNFWKVLSAVFPSRTNMEIVSYYFNVFMLQKRAEQNRDDPRNVDSDNDEWQLSDDDDFDPDEKTDEEEDSAVESPVCHVGNDAMYQLKDFNSLMDYPFDDLGSHRDLMSQFDCDTGIELLEERYDEDSNNTHGSSFSYTSSDSITTAQLPLEKTDCSNEWQDFILEPCDHKAWSGYSSCAKEEFDFLPTCSMIQEIFGDGSLDADVKRR